MASTRPVIAHVLHRLDRAGAEVLAAGLARGLREQFDCVFYCLDGLGPLADEMRGEGFVVESLGRRPGIDRGLAKRMRSLLQAHHVSLIHAHQYTPFFYSALARGLFKHRLARVTPGAVLFTEHGRHYPDTRSTKRVLANKLLLGRRDRVTAVGGFVRDALVANEGIAGERIEVVYNGITPGDPPTDAERVAARDRLAVDTGRVVVMQVARFHTVKDHATALRAWARVCETLGGANPPLLVLVGEGDERPKMQALADELKLHNTVRFTGALDLARELIPAADICLLTSLSEGVSVTLLEAMAAQRPVVATEVGGNPEVVADGRTGLLAPRGDADAIAARLLDLIREPNSAQALGAAGRARLLERFTAERMHADYARLYEAMADAVHRSR